MTEIKAQPQPQPKPIAAEPIEDGYRVTYSDGTQADVSADTLRTMAVRPLGKPWGTPGVAVGGGKVSSILT